MALRWGTAHGPHALVVYLLGLLALFVGERLIGGDGSIRLVVSGLGLGGTVLAMFLFLMAWLGSNDQVRRVERLAFLLSLLGLCSMAVYVFASDLLGPMRALARAGDSGPGLRQISSVVWPILLCCSIVPLLFVQWSMASMGHGRGVEFTRVTASFRSSLTLSAFLCTLFLVNALANRLDVHSDLSFFKTTSPSPGTLELVAEMDQPTQALLVFPGANEVLAEVEPYFAQLAESSEQFSMRRIDLALEPELAEKYRVGKDGALVLVRKAAHQKIDLGLDLDKAKKKLRKLDSEFQNGLMKLLFAREMVYLVTGHGERSYAKVEGDARARIAKLRSGLQQARYTVKRLAPTSGLLERVPADAAAVLWVGPRAPLLPGEQRALEQYLNRGGRMLLLLDPEAEEQPQGLLGFLGLQLGRDLLGHSKYFMPLSRTAADRYNLVTNKFANHPASKTVSRYSRDLPVIFSTTGSLSRTEKKNPNNRLTFLVRSMKDTWADGDGDRQRSAQEKLQVHQLAAAVSRKIEARSAEDKAPPPDPQGQSLPKPALKDREPEREMRVAVFADADLFSDEAFKYEGNRVLLADVLRWLVEAERLPGPPSSEEDVPVVHTRSEDQVWFYSTVFAVPLAILLIGVFSGWGRGRRRRPGQ